MVAKIGELEQTFLKVVREWAYLHDLGKVNVPHEILNKVGSLTDEEFEVIRKHLL